VSVFYFRRRFEIFGVRSAAFFFPRARFFTDHRAMRRILLGSRDSHEIPVIFSSVSVLGRFSDRLTVPPSI